MDGGREIDPVNKVMAVGSPINKFQDMDTDMHIMFTKPIYSSFFFSLSSMLTMTRLLKFCKDVAASLVYISYSRSIDKITTNSNRMNPTHPDTAKTNLTSSKYQELVLEMGSI